MLRLTCLATTQKNAKEMSFLRRLIYHGRLMIKYSKIFNENCWRNLGDLKYYTIELKPGTSGGFRSQVTQASAKGSKRIDYHGYSNSVVSEANTTPSTLQWVGEKVHAHVRKIFLNNVLNRAKASEDLRNRTIQRMMYGDSKPFFALVGLSMAGGSAGLFSEQNEYEGICWEIRESLARRNRRKTKTIWSSAEDIRNEGNLTVKDLNFHELIQRGCNAVVYAANWANENIRGKAVLAVKMMFNYHIESNASYIMRGMAKELVPARSINFQSMEELTNGVFKNIKRCPPHPNIVDITHAFVDRVPLLPEGLENYPSALPSRLNPADGLGRNMSLFLVMKRYDMNLNQLLTEHDDLRFRSRLFIFLQLLEGVGFLEKMGISHRDLKTDNILISLSNGLEIPHVVISDFGCCLADKVNGLNLPFRCEDVDRGGNASLMAPEVKTAIPGAWRWISYEKSDAWACGAISYEIFGEKNPFYAYASNKKKLDSGNYDESNLLPVPSTIKSPALKELILGLLKKAPSERLNSREASTICSVICFGPSSWLLFPDNVTDNDIMEWLVNLTTKVLCQQRTETEPECKLIETFLKRINFQSVRNAIEWLSNHNCK